MTLEGEIVVKLAWDGRRVGRVDLTSTRPRLASRILTGKTAAAAAATVPLLYSICGGAQGAAAASALAAAGAAGFGEDTGKRTAGIIVESLQEGFWHLLIGWPNAMDSECNVTPVTTARYLIATSTRASDGTDLLGDGAAMRELAAGLSRIAERALFAMTPADFLALPDVAALRAWTARAETVPARLLGYVLAQAAAPRPCAVGLMPPPQRAALLDVIVPALRDDPDFASAPTWAGAPVETGALARMRDHPAVMDCERSLGRTAATRIVARMLEIALSLKELAGEVAPDLIYPPVQGIGLEAGSGLGVVETARGLLLHRARVRDECVVDYQIVAPTEWNFHPAGVLVQGLSGIEADDRAALLRRARLDVHTLDPCVACRVEVADA